MNPKDRNNARDREIGAHWERQFCLLAARYGKVFTPHQIGRPESAQAYERNDQGWSNLTLPDVTIWSAPGEHHEVKHKNRTRDELPMYGLEEYRLTALVRFANTTGQRVLYTIHDWEIAGARSASEPVESRLEHWFVGDVASLSRQITKTRPGWTYYAGGQRKLPIHYWVAQRHFRPLAELWAPPQTRLESELRAADPPRTDGEWPDVATRRPPDYKGAA